MLQELQEKEAVAANQRSCISLLGSVQIWSRTQVHMHGPAKLMEMLQSRTAQLEGLYKVITGEGGFAYLAVLALQQPAYPQVSPAPAPARLFPPAARACPSSPPFLPPGRCGVYRNGGCLPSCLQ